MKEKQEDTDHKIHFEKDRNQKLENEVEMLQKKDEKQKEEIQNLKNISSNQPSNQGLDSILEKMQSQEKIIALLQERLEKVENDQILNDKK